MLVDILTNLKHAANVRITTFFGYFPSWCCLCFIISKTSRMSWYFPFSNKRSIRIWYVPSWAKKSSRSGSLNTWKIQEILESSTTLFNYQPTQIPSLLSSCPFQDCVISLSHAKVTIFFNYKSPIAIVRTLKKPFSHLNSSVIKWLWFTNDRDSIPSRCRDLFFPQPHPDWLLNGYCSSHSLVVKCLGQEAYHTHASL